MTDNITLRSVFESKRSELEQKLSGLLLPNDAEKVQQIITKYLSELFDEEDEFRQNLTQGEDLIVKAALSLLEAQQRMSSTLFFQRKEHNAAVSKIHLEPKESKSDYLHQPISATSAMIGSGGGALLGQMIFGGWGAVFGAIAGTAISVYVASRNVLEQENFDKCPCEKEEQSIQGESINVQSFFSIIGNICDGVDNLVATFRNQISRVVNKYENQEKPSLEKNFQFLLENIQTMIGYSRTHCEDEKFSTKVRERIEDLAETLDNYNLTVVDYQEGVNDSWFEQVESSTATERKMAYPAIIKGDQVVLQGKVFIPNN